MASAVPVRQAVPQCRLSHELRSVSALTCHPVALRSWMRNWEVVLCRWVEESVWDYCIEVPLCKLPVVVALQGYVAVRWPHVVSAWREPPLAASPWVCPRKASHSWSNVPVHGQCWLRISGSSGDTVQLYFRPLAGVRQPVLRVVLLKRLVESALPTAWLVLRIGTVYLSGLVVLRRRENHIWGKILTFVAKAHGNAGTASSRSSCSTTGWQTFVSGKRSTGLFWIACYSQSPIISAHLVV
jgi:hypothetical protein